MHPFLGPTTGQQIGNALVEGSRTIVWPRGGNIEKQDVSFWVTAWQGMGGSAAGSFQALRYLLRQIEQLAQNPDLQPVYIQWSSTAQPSQYNAADPHDGWYLIENFQPDYTTVVGGSVKVKLTVNYVAPALPANLRAWWAGAALSSNYAVVPSGPLIAYPLGATGQSATATSRTGAEGSIPISTSLSTSVLPAPFVPPAVANLFKGACRVYDTLNTSSNPVPTAGSFVNANWVEAKGWTHDFIGDCVVTNGLLLLLYQVGQAGAPSVYLWNTSLGTPAWQLQGSIQYQDNAGNAGTVRTLDLVRVGMEEARVRVTLNTSAGNWLLLKQKLQRGRYDAYCECWPQSQSHTSQTNLLWIANSAYATGFTDATSSTTFPSNLAVSTNYGYAAAQGSASGSPIFGFLYQNKPTTAQGRLVSSTQLGLGDTTGPAQGGFTLYGFFAIPYSGAVVLATAQGIVNPIFQQFSFDRLVSWVRG